MPPGAVPSEGSVSIFSRGATALLRGVARNETRSLPVRSIIKTMIAQWTVRPVARFPRWFLTFTAARMIARAARRYVACGRGKGRGREKGNALARSSVIKVGYYLDLRRLQRFRVESLSALHARISLRWTISLASFILLSKKKIDFGDLAAVVPLADAFDSQI